MITGPCVEADPTYILNATLQQGENSAGKVDELWDLKVRRIC